MSKGERGFIPLRAVQQTFTTLFINQISNVQGITTQSDKYKQIFYCRIYFLEKSVLTYGKETI